MVEWKRLGEIAKITNGERPILEILEKGKYAYINAGRTNSGYINDFNSEKGAITTPSHGEGGIGSVMFQKQNFWCGALCYKIYVDNNVNNRYLFHYLSNNSRLIFDCKNVGGLPYINRKQLEKIAIETPSLSEQNHIVGILDTFTDSIENLKQQIAQRRKQYEHLIDNCFGGTYNAMMGKANKGEIIVEPLSAHGTFTRGKRFVRTDIVEEGQPCIHYGDMYTTYGLSATETVTHLPYDFPKKMRYVKPGDVVIVGAGENNEDIGVGLAWFGNEPAAVHDACYIYESNFNPMYLSYFLRSGIYHLQIKSNVVRGKICSISSNGIGRALIPIISKERQKEIVDSLLPFEDLLKNLNLQLSLRQKQYEYYRNKLLTFE